MRIAPRRFAGLTFAVAGGLLSACYLTTDLGGLSGGAPASDGGSGDSSVMVGMADAKDATEARDARDDGPLGDGAVFVCPSGAFCDDFERSTIQGGWDFVQQSALNTLEITSHARTGLGALRSTIGNAQGSGGGFMTRNVGLVKKVAFDFWVFIGAAITRAVNLAAFTIPSNGGRHSISLFFFLSAGGSMSVAEQENDSGAQTFFATKGSASFVFGRWVACHLEVDVSAMPATARADYDGLTIFAGPLSRAYASAPAQMSLGVSYAMSGPTLQVDHDDVVLVVTPQ